MGCDLDQGPAASDGVPDVDEDLVDPALDLGADRHLLEREERARPESTRRATLRDDDGHHPRPDRP